MLLKVQVKNIQVFSSIGWILKKNGKEERDSVKYMGLENFGGVLQDKKFYKSPDIRCVTTPNLCSVRTVLPYKILQKAGCPDIAISRISGIFLAKYVSGAHV